jgi:hypothetical protein
MNVPLKLLRITWLVSASLLLICAVSNFYAKQRMDEVTEELKISIRRADSLAHEAQYYIKRADSLTHKLNKALEVISDTLSRQLYSVPKNQMQGKGRTALFSSPS